MANTLPLSAAALLLHLLLSPDLLLCSAIDTSPTSITKKHGRKRISLGHLEIPQIFDRVNYVCALYD